MAKENYTTWSNIKNDNARYVITPNNIQVTGQTRFEDQWVADDKGAAFFDGDLIHHFDFSIDNANASGLNGVWALANAVNDQNDLQDYITILVAFSGGNHVVFCRERSGGGFNDDIWTGAAQSTTYHPEVERDEGAGELICRIFSDASRDTLVTVLTITLVDNTVDWQFVYGSQSFNDSNAGTFDGHSANLDLNPSAVSRLPRRGIGRGILRGIQRGL